VYNTSHDAHTHTTKKLNQDTTDALHTWHVIVATNRDSDQGRTHGSSNTSQTWLTVKGKRKVD